MCQLIYAELALFDAQSDPLPDAGVVVDGNRIVAVGDRETLARAYPDATLAGGAGYFLLPGMVNSHDHGRGIGSLPLGTPDDLLEIWLPGLYSLPALDPYLQAAWEGIRLLHSGVTLTAHSHNPRDWLGMAEDAPETLRGYGDAGVRVAFHPPIVDQHPLVYGDRALFEAGLPPTARAAAARFLAPCPLDAHDYFALCEELFARHHDAAEHMVHIQVSPAGGQWCSDELVLQAVDFARRHGTRVQMHMLETQYQRIYAHRRWNTSFIRHLDDIGALGPWLTLAHMVWIEEEDIPLLAERGVGVAHNPSSNLRLRSGVAPIPELLAGGVQVGVGLDGHTLDDDQDYLRELRLAWTLANRPGAEAPTVSASAFLKAGAQTGAAITLGGDVELGVLRKGALADLVLLDWEAVQGVWSSPLLDPLTLLLRRAQASHVRHVMVNGAWRLRDGHVTGLDEEAIAAALREDLARSNPTELAQRAEAARVLAPFLRRFYREFGA